MLLIEKQSGRSQNKFWLTFALCALAAGLMLLPFWIVDKGIFLYAGDFNTQQIPFSYHINDFIEQGGGSFDWAADLGGGFINSYSFYLLGSPFFWLASIFPAAAQPYLMVPLLMLKFGTAGAGAYLWARRYCVKSNYAVLAGCLYAMSGFNLYNVFFNHFVDVAALFPFLLWALDETVLEKKHGLLVPIVALNLLVNYFFFVGEVLFLVLYFICMILGHQYTINKKMFWQLAFECVLGCGLGVFLAWPALLSLQHNPRTFKFADGAGLLMYSKPQQYFAILASLFFPPDPPYLPAIFTEGVIKWTSLSAYLPAIGFAGTLAYLRGSKGTPWRKLLPTCMIFAMVPVLNSSFYALNSSYYARWFYMPVLIMCGATVSMLEFPNVRVLKSSVRITAIITAAFAAFALVPDKVEDEWTIGIVKSQPQFWLSLALALLGLALFWCVWKGWPGRPRPRALVALVLCFGCLVGMVEIGIGKFTQWDHDKNYTQTVYRNARGLELPEEGFYRTDSYESYDNLSLWMNRPSLQSFNSTVAPSILEFYPAVDVKRDVNSHPEPEQNALRGLLSVKYLLCDKGHQAEYEEKAVEGWKSLGDANGFALYENENFIPMGFAYDYYVTAEQLEKTAKANRAQLMCKAIVLDEEQIAEYGPLLEPIPEGLRNATGYRDYQDAVAARRAMACTEFIADSTGFTARANPARDTLMMFSVPWDAGFTATVNGQEAPVLKVNSGLTAIPVPAGECDIHLTYRTPGLRQALTLSGICLLIYAGYVVYHLRRRKGPHDGPALPQADVSGATEGTTAKEDL